MYVPNDDATIQVKQFCEIVVNKKRKGHYEILTEAFEEKRNPVVGLHGDDIRNDNGISIIIIKNKKYTQIRLGAKQTT